MVVTRSPTYSFLTNIKTAHNSFLLALYVRALSPEITKMRKVNAHAITILALLPLNNRRCDEISSSLIALRATLFIYLKQINHVFLT